MPKREVGVANPRQPMPMRFVFQSKTLPYVGAVRDLDDTPDLVLDRQTAAVRHDLGHDLPHKMSLEDPVKFKRYLKRIQRPTVAQLARERATLNEVLEIQNIGEYEWSIEGMKKFDEGMKQMYKLDGHMRRTPVWGRSKHER